MSNSNEIDCNSEIHDMPDSKHHVIAIKSMFH